MPQCYTARIAVSNVGTLLTAALSFVHIFVPLVSFNLLLRHHSCQVSLLVEAVYRITLKGV